MKAVGIVAEYNPFHNGHQLHIAQAKAQSGCDYVIAVMSGNFVQRGEPAIVDKYARTRMALSGGVDMVIELPVYYAASGAEYFARNAVKLLHTTGLVTALAFGSECGELAELELAALAKENPQVIKESLKRGESYARARGAALACELLPNDILAVEYIRAIQQIGADIKPLAIKRQVADYHSREICADIASATAIRLAALNNIKAVERAMPETAYRILCSALESGEYVSGLDAYSGIFSYILRTNNRLEEILDVSEGIHNRFIEMSGRYSSLSDIISAVKTKRYTLTRLNRAALHMLLDIRLAELKSYEYPPYIRVLGLKKTASPLMNALVSSAACPVVTYIKPARKALDEHAWSMLEKEMISTDIYYLGFNTKSPVPSGAERRRELIII